MAESRGIKIFLGHASDDKAAVLSLYERLKDQGYDPWLDTKNLLPGDNWREEIPKAIKSSDIFIACLSSRSVDKDGYIQQELRLALMSCAQKSSSSVYLIPLRLEECKIPDLQLPSLGVNLRDYHWLDYWEAGSFELLVRSIERIEVSLPEPSPPSSSASTSSDSFPDALPVPSTGKLKRFSFEVITVDSWGQETHRRENSAEHFLKYLGNDVYLEMVLIPGGEFLMGSFDDEPERSSWESPQHRVRVAEFFMSRYPVTQSQWRVVAGLLQVNRQLKSDPSHFTGPNHPVEQVSWPEAVEFCDRISRLSGHHYMLPSEAQWEYACRGGTLTPFHFGLTLTSEFANYWAEHTYGEGPRGSYRTHTTKVGSFPANNFGLNDMHGNVVEWCLDDWHESYDGCPLDGSAWLDKNSSRYHIVRGGSWATVPKLCRSAHRIKLVSDYVYKNVGFRVSCASPRAL